MKKSLIPIIALLMSSLGNAQQLVQIQPQPEPNLPQTYHVDNCGHRTSCGEACIGEDGYEGMGIPFFYESTCQDQINAEGIAECKCVRDEFEVPLDPYTACMKIYEQSLLPNNPFYREEAENYRKECQRLRDRGLM